MRNGKAKPAAPATSPAFMKLRRVVVMGVLSLGGEWRFRILTQRVQRLAQSSQGLFVVFVKKLRVLCVKTHFRLFENAMQYSGCGRMFHVKQIVYSARFLIGCHLSHRSRDFLEISQARDCRGVSLGL